MKILSKFLLLALVCVGSVYVLSAQNYVVVPAVFCKDSLSPPEAIHKGITHVISSCTKDVYLISNFDMQNYKEADSLMQRYTKNETPEQRKLVESQRQLQLCEDNRQTLMQTFDSAINPSISSLNTEISRLTGVESLLRTAHSDLTTAHSDLEAAIKELKVSKKKQKWNQILTGAAGVIVGGLVVLAIN